MSNKVESKTDRKKRQRRAISRRHREKLKTKKLRLDAIAEFSKNLKGYSGTSKKDWKDFMVTNSNLVGLSEDEIIEYAKKSDFYDEEIG